MVTSKKAHTKPIRFLISLCNARRATSRRVSNPGVMRKHGAFLIQRNKE
nr:MAG TPA: hypothetical protein [Caudoviricetes sp.]